MAGLLFNPTSKSEQLEYPGEIFDFIVVVHLFAFGTSSSGFYLFILKRSISLVQITWHLGLKNILIPKLTGGTQSICRCVAPHFVVQYLNIALEAKKSAFLELQYIFIFYKEIKPKNSKAALRPACLLSS